MSQDYFAEEDVILTKLEFDHCTDKNDANSFHISYGIDKNFLFGCGISIASVLLSNPESKFVFHIFTDYFSDNDREKFDALAAQYNSRVVVYLINCEKLKVLPSTKNWTYATYFRFIIADYFSGKIDKILYLDADIVCKGSVQELIDLSFDESEIAAVVAEGDIEWWKKRSITLDTPNLINGYFNAGFLLINLPAWSKYNISTRAIDMLKDPEAVKKITHLDQDVLNILLAGNDRFVDGKFNTQYSINYELKKDKVFDPIPNSCVFIHYIGPTKPWHIWANYPVSEYFNRAKENSPWQSVSLLSPSTSHQFRYSAKHYFKQGLILKCIYSYINYYAKKLF